MSISGRGISEEAEISRVLNRNCWLTGKKFDLHVVSGYSCSFCEVSFDKSIHYNATLLLSLWFSFGTNFKCSFIEISMFTFVCVD